MAVCNTYYSSILIHRLTALFLCAAAAVLLSLCLLTLAVRGERLQQAAPQTSAPVPDTLIVVLSADQNGHLTPCGCAKPMLGGLPRRATYLRSLAPQAALIRVENGDLTEALGRQDELKAETTVDILNHLAYDAISLGEKDFRLGLPYLQALQHRFKGALLCANARRPDGSPLFKEVAVVQRDHAGKPVRVLLMGLLSDQFAEQIHALNPDVQLEPPSETLQRLQPEIAAQGDVRILLYHGPKAEAADLARQFPLFQLVVYAHETDPPVEKERVGETALACSGEDGKYMGRAALTTGSAWRVADVKYTALGPDFAEDPRVLELKWAYLERVAAEDLLGKVVKVPTTNGDTFAGSAACAPCHAAAHRIWKGSPHAKAMQTLVEEKHDRDPECVACHVVGLDRQSGFVSRAKTPHLQDVGCESCHGAAAKHVKDPATPMPKAGSASCLQCHVPEHSPNFDFAKYWPKIKH